MYSHCHGFCPTLCIARWESQLKFFWQINFPALEHNHNLVTIFPRIIFIYENFDLDTTGQMRCKYNQIIPPHFSPLADIPGTLFVHNV